MCPTHSRNSDGNQTLRLGRVSFFRVSLHYSKFHGSTEQNWQRRFRPGRIVRTVDDTSTVFNRYESRHCTVWVIESAIIDDRVARDATRYSATKQHRLWIRRDQLTPQPTLIAAGS